MKCAVKEVARKQVYLPVSPASPPNWHSTIALYSRREVMTEAVWTTWLLEKEKAGYLIAASGQRAYIPLLSPQRFPKQDTYRITDNHFPASQLLYFTSL